MSDYTPLEQWLYDTGVAMPGDVRRIARKIETSEWLASHDAEVRASATRPNQKRPDCCWTCGRHVVPGGGDAGAIGTGNSPRVTGQTSTGPRGRQGGTEHSTKIDDPASTSQEPSEAQVEAAARALFEEPGHDPNSPDFMSWDEVVATDGKRADLWRDDARRVLRAARAVSNEVSATDIGAERHYYPEDDPMKHGIQDDGCACAPTVVELRLKDGSPSRYVVHRSIEAPEKNGGA